jgi:excisionase family DNA binding protein
MSDEPKSPYYTINEAAAYLRISPPKLRSLIASGEIPARRYGPRSVRILHADLNRDGRESDFAA